MVGVLPGIIGLRQANQDRGREDVTGSGEDAGEMKVPSLRNVGLRETFMHTGEFTTLNQVINHYENPAVNNDRDNIPGGGNYNFNVNNEGYSITRNVVCYANRQVGFGIQVPAKADRRLVAPAFQPRNQAGSAFSEIIISNLESSIFQQLAQVLCALPLLTGRIDRVKRE